MVSLVTYPSTNLLDFSERATKLALVATISLVLLGICHWKYMQLHYAQTAVLVTSFEADIQLQPMINRKNITKY